VVLIAISSFRFQGITTPALGAPPLLNQEGSISMTAGGTAAQFGCTVTQVAKGHRRRGGSHV